MRFEEDICLVLNTVCIQGHYHVCLKQGEFNEDMVHIIQTALSNDEEFPTRRKHSNSVKSIFIRVCTEFASLFLLYVLSVSLGLICFLLACLLFIFLFLSSVFFLFFFLVCFLFLSFNPAGVPLSRYDCNEWA